MTTAFVNFGQTDGIGIPGRENDREGRRRDINFTDGNGAWLEATDPFGFWVIRWKEGKTPVELKEQHFTSADLAKRELDRWLDQNRYNTKTTDQKVTIPELKTKGKSNAA